MDCCRELCRCRGLCRRRGPIDRIAHGRDPNAPVIAGIKPARKGLLTGAVIAVFASLAAFLSMGVAKGDSGASQASTVDASGTVHVQALDVPFRDAHRKKCGET